MRTSRISIAIVLLLTVLTGGNGAWAEYHWQRTCRRCCLPKHNYGADTPRFSAIEFAVAEPATGTAARLRKPFQFRATSLEVDHLRLEQIGLVLYQTDGRLVATGRITHSGGDGGLIGNNVTIRIRAFVAASNDPTRIPPDAVAIWTTEHELWVPRGGPQAIELVPTSKQLHQSERLKAHFEDITHLEVELNYRRDR